MSIKVEKTENNMAKIVVTVAAADFNKALTFAYNKNKSRFDIPGFRKGKAPQQIVEKNYGVEVLFDDAIDHILNETYPAAAKESELDIVSRPEISVDEIGKGKDFVYTATVATKPEVELGEYKGVEVEKADTKVKAAEVNAKLKEEQEKNARIVEVERAAKKDDIVIIDFVGSVDGEEFPGGKGEGYELTIGSHTFIDGFEDQLKGSKAGDDVEVNVTFPEEYGAKDLAGKAAIFKVHVTAVKEKELPKLDDEFAQEVSEFDTLADYKKSIKAEIKKQKDVQATTENENRVIEKVVENAKVEIPEPMLESQVQNMIYDYAMRLQQQGIPFDQYMKITGMTEETLKEQMRPSALKNTKTGLVLETILKKENIEVSDEAVEAEFEKMAKQYEMKLEDLMKSVDDAQKESMKQQLAMQETIDMLVSEAKLKAPSKAKKEEK